MFGLTGWKTLAAGLSSIATGLGLLINGAMGCFDPAVGCNGENLTEGITLISLGLGMIGIGHKVEKAAGS